MALGTPFMYSDLNQVPVELRSYKNAKLNAQQINEIVADAYAHAITHPNGIEVPDWGNAKSRFETSHHIDLGYWVNN
jgi:carbamate kinase